MSQSQKMTQQIEKCCVLVGMKYWQKRSELYNNWEEFFIDEMKVQNNQLKEKYNKILYRFI